MQKMNGGMKINKQMEIIIIKWKKMINESNLMNGDNKQIKT